MNLHREFREASPRILLLVIAYQAETILKEVLDRITRTFLEDPSSLCVAR